MPLLKLQKLSLESNKPVIENIYSDNGNKLIAIAMKKGVLLADHKAPSKAKLIVIKGEIDFNISAKSYRLAVPDSLEIPLDETHSVSAFEDALFLLLLSN